MRERVARLSDDEQEAALGVADLAGETQPGMGLRVCPRGVLAFVMHETTTNPVTPPPIWSDCLVLQRPCPILPAGWWLAWWSARNAMVRILVKEWWPAAARS